MEMLTVNNKINENIKHKVEQAQATHGFNWH